MFLLGANYLCSSRGHLQQRPGYFCDNNSNNNVNINNTNNNNIIIIINMHISILSSTS